MPSLQRDAHLSKRASGHESGGDARVTTAVYKERLGSPGKLRKEDIQRKQNEGGMKFSVLVRRAG